MVPIDISAGEVRGGCVNSRAGRRARPIRIEMASVGPNASGSIHASSTAMLVDEFMPVYDVSDGVATVVEADVATTWAALMDVDLIEVGRKRPLVGVLGAIRMLPSLVGHLTRGEAPPSRPRTLRLRDLANISLDQGGWVLLGERDKEEIALGLIGKFWRPSIEFAAVTSPAAFRAFQEPGFAKTIYALSVCSLEGNRTLLSGVMRTMTTDEVARRWFRWYWTGGVGTGAHVLVNGLLDVTREMAEEAKAVRRAPGPPPRVAL